MLLREIQTVYVRLKKNLDVKQFSLKRFTCVLRISKRLFENLEKLQYLVHTVHQGWEFAHRFSEQIALFLSKNERMSNSLKKMRDSLKKMSDSLIGSYLVSDLSDSLTIAHFL